MESKLLVRNKKPGNIRLKEIADAANVSIATVSLALRGHPSVANKTRNLIFHTQQRLGDQLEQKYHEGAKPRELCFLYYITDFSLGESVYSPLLNGVIRMSKQLGIRLELSSISSSDFPLVPEKIDGVILTGELTPDMVEHFVHQNQKVVVAGNYQFKGINTVEIDSFYNGGIIAEKVIEDGYRQIIFNQLRPENYFERQFLAGFRDGLISRGIPFPDSHVICVPDPEIQHSASVDKILAFDPPVEAIVCSSQQTAEAYMAELLADERLEKDQLPAVYALRLGEKKVSPSRIKFYNIQMEAVGEQAVRRLHQMVAQDMAPYTIVIKNGFWST